MGWRFQKRVRLMPGVTLNFSRKGVSTSIGARGARVTLGHGQRRTTLGIPGSGISHTTISKKNGVRRAQQRRVIASPPEHSSSMGRLLKLILIACGLFIFTIVFAGSAWAINKCVTTDGKVTYQEEKCPSGASEHDVKLHDNAAQAEGVYMGSQPRDAGPRHYGRDHVYTGPRGGRYKITESGNKRYIPRK